jgi:hypothetical protein
VSSTRTSIFNSCKAKPFTPKIVTSSQTGAFERFSEMSVLRSEGHGKTVVVGTPSRLRVSGNRLGLYFDRCPGWIVLGVGWVGQVIRGRYEGLIMLTVVR